LIWKYIKTTVQSYAQQISWERNKEKINLFLNRLKKKIKRKTKIMKKGDSGSPYVLFGHIIICLLRKKEQYLRRK